MRNTVLLLVNENGELLLVNPKNVIDLIQLKMLEYPVNQQILFIDEATGTTDLGKDLRRYKRTQLPFVLGFPVQEKFLHIMSGLLRKMKNLIKFILS